MCGAGSGASGPACLLYRVQTNTRRMLCLFIRRCISFRERGKGMPKLYFKYGAMNSSKSANALMVKFNYEEQGYRVALLKPSIDDRDGTEVVKSRIGLEQRCYVIDEDMNLLDWYDAHREYQVLIVDEAQFLTPEQVNNSRTWRWMKFPCCALD